MIFINTIEGRGFNTIMGFKKCFDKSQSICVLHDMRSMQCDMHHSSETPLEKHKQFQDLEKAHLTLGLGRFLSESSEKQVQDSSVIGTPDVMICRWPN